MVKAIECEGLTKSYVRKLRQPGFLGAVKGLFSNESELVPAVQGLGFSIERGERVGLIGENGAGLAVPPFWACGVLTYTSVLVWFGCLSFRFVGPQLASMMIGHNLLQATRYPLSIYPSWVRGLLLFVVPVGSFHYLPASVFFGKHAPLIALGLAPVAAVVTVFLAQKAWKLGLSYYESSGS
jgi:ABC-2 type transport system permease protein